MARWPPGYWFPPKTLGCRETDSGVDYSIKKVDYLIAPTVPIPPFKIGEKIDDPVALFLVDFNTVTANLTGKPAISVLDVFHYGGGNEQITAHTNDTEKTLAKI